MKTIQDVSLPCHVETRTDAHQILLTESHRAAYVAEYGNVEVEYNAEYKYWRVPAFAAEVAAYTAAKAKDCAIWGCE